MHFVKCCRSTKAETVLVLFNASASERDGAESSF